MGANSRAHQNGGVSGIRQGDDGLLVEEGSVGEGIRFLHLGDSKSSHEDDLTVPGGLEDLTRGQLGDIELLVGVSDISGVGVHLGVDDGGEGLHKEDVVGEDESLEHIDLSSLDFVVSVLLVPQSVLIEPVVDLGLGVERISEVGGSGGGNPVHGSVRGQEVISQFLILPLVILLDDTEVPHRGRSCRHKLAHNSRLSHFSRTLLF
mmetsp:Transcript_24605/g.38213  ORF Transcript_24605/g.38213 Transcript_24605/m.38213 type:complete len:206 (-) Transcript_24605:145-762(-)